MGTLAPDPLEFRRRMAARFDLEFPLAAVSYSCPMAVVGAV